MPESLEHELNASKTSLEEFALETGLAASVGSQPSRYRSRLGEAKTVSARSLDVYLRRGINLLNEYMKTLGEDEALISKSAWPESLPSPLSWVEWLIQVKSKSLVVSSWRLYRRSALEALHSWPEKSGYIEEALKLIEKEDLGSNQKLGQSLYSLRRAQMPETKTSGKRLRFISPNDLVAILASCFSMHAFRANIVNRSLPGDSVSLGLADWLVAGIATGLRPNEWRQSRLVYVPSDKSPELKLTPALKAGQIWSSTSGQNVDLNYLATTVWPSVSVFSELSDVADIQGSLWLLTYNEKHSNNRGNQAIRSLDISLSPIVVKLAILRMVIRGLVFFQNYEWHQFYENTRHKLAYLNTELFDGRNARIHLYSSRHQALANFKRETGTFNASVLAGHGVGDTSGIYYCSRVYAWSSRWSEIVDAIIQTDEERIASLLQPEQMEINSQGRYRKKRHKRNGKGGVSSSVLGTISEGIKASIAMALSGLAANPTPSAHPEEVRSLMMRDEARLMGNRNSVGVTDPENVAVKGAGPSMGM